MPRGSPQQLAARYGSEATEIAFEEARQAKAPDHLRFATARLQERYGQGDVDAGKKRKVLCDDCSLPHWIDDMAVRGNEALCESCAQPPEPGIAAIWDVIFRGTVIVHEAPWWQREPTPTARKVAAFWERA